MVFGKITKMRGQTSSKYVGLFRFFVYLDDFFKFSDDFCGYIFKLVCVITRIIRSGWTGKSWLYFTVAAVWNFDYVSIKRAENCQNRSVSVLAGHRTLFSVSNFVQGKVGGHVKNRRNKRMNECGTHTDVYVFRIFEKSGYLKWTREKPTCLSD